MAFGIKVEVWGDYALFTRPEMKTERVTYDVMTPSAARGILEAIYWHKGVVWHIDKIHICNPIKFINVRRNEVSAKISASTMKSIAVSGIGESYISTSDTIQQRASIILKDVHYVIEAHFSLSDDKEEGTNEGKVCDIMRRRLERGQCFHQPYFGCREFPAKFKMYSSDNPPEICSELRDKTIDLGYMLYDMDYSQKGNIRPMFYRASIVNGVMNLKDCEVFS